MKIAYVLSTCAKSGPFIVARDIINNIHTKVEAIDIYYIKESDHKMDFKARLFKVNLYSKTDLSTYDIIHSHGFLGDLYTYLNKASIKGKWITTLHQDIKPDYSMNYNALIGNWLEKVWTHIVNKSNCVVTLSQQMVKYYESTIKDTTLTYVYNGVSPQVHDNEDFMLEDIKSRYTTLGISANLIYRKGIDKAIESLTLPTASELCLIIIGEGRKKKELIKLANKMMVMERVFFLGYKSNAIDYFKYFDVYIMCSRSEGFGLCVIEAASQKIPVICNDLPIYRELFSDEQVIRFNLDNLESIVGAAVNATRNKNSLSEAIYKKYCVFYSSEVMAKKYFDLYLKFTQISHAFSK